MRLPTPRVDILRSITAAGALAAAASAVVAARPTSGALPATSVPDTILSLVTGIGSVLVGLESLRRRQHGTTGWLLAGAGIAWLAIDWSDPASGNPWLFTFGLVLRATYAALVADLAFRYPGDLALGRSDVAIVASGYAIAVGLVGVVPTLFYSPTSAGCSACPTNLLMLAASPDAWPATSRLALTGAAAWGTGAAALSAARLWRATAASRRAGWPVLVPAGVLLMAFAAEAAHDVALGAFGTNELDLWLWRVQAVALAGITIGVVSAWVRARLVRDRVAHLVLDSATSLEPGGLRLVLAELVGDPELALAYPMSDGRWADEHGGPVVPESRPGRRLTPIQRSGETLALLDHRVGIEDDRARMDELIRAARLGLERERLSAEMEVTLAELRASRARIVEADDRERQRLERDLHDGAQQRLVALAIALRLAGDGAPEGARSGVGEAIADLRRVAHGLYPAALADEGLAAGLEALAEEADSPIRVQMPDLRLPPSVETTAYLLVADTVRGSSGGTVEVSGQIVDDRLLLDLSGLRTVPESIEELGDRVAALDGRLTIESGEGKPLTLRAELPCAW